MKKKNLLFIARNYPPNIGGMEILNFELTKQLKKYFCLNLIYNSGHRYSVTFLIKSFLKALISSERNVFLSDPLLSPYVPFLKILGKKVVIKVHGLDIIGPNVIYQLLIPFFISLADGVICISKATQKECIRRKIKVNKIAVITPGINPYQYFSPDSKNSKKNNLLFKKNGINLINNKILLSIGRLVKRKGNVWFIENVMPKLPEDLIYVIAGIGPEVENIKMAIENKKLDDRVFLLGKISEEEKKILLNVSDVFIMPNILVKGDMEGFGISAIEASSCGLPVVASSIEGLKDAVKNGLNGFLVRPANFQEYVRKINGLVKNKDLRLGKIRKYTTDTYSWDKLGKQYVKFLEKISV